MMVVMEFVEGGSLSSYLEKLRVGRPEGDRVERDSQRGTGVEEDTV